jgi:beta-lactam-binding protein with PASTA domain
MESDGFETEVADEGTYVVGQSPGPGTKLSPGARVILRTATMRTAAQTVRVPDLRNLSLRRAINRLTVENLRISTTGSGRVVAQSPAPGASVKPGTIIAVRCDPGTQHLAAAH